MKSKHGRFYCHCLKDEQHPRPCLDVSHLPPTTNLSWFKIHLKFFSKMVLREAMFELRVTVFFDDFPSSDTHLFRCK